MLALSEILVDTLSLAEILALWDFAVLSDFTALSLSDFTVLTLADSLFLTLSLKDVLSLSFLSSDMLLLLSKLFDSLANNDVLLLFERDSLIKAEYDVETDADALSDASLTDTDSLSDSAWLFASDAEV